MNGLNISPGICTRIYAPNIPPIIPGIISFLKSCLSTFPKLKCEIPDINVVKTSDIWTDELIKTGGSPVPNRNVVAVTPYAIPIAPSISCATKPIKTIE